MKKCLTKILLLTVLVAVTVSVLVLPSHASAYNNKDIYIKVDGIEGESKDSKHDKWIDVLDFQHGSVQSVQTGSPDAAGRGIYEPIVFKHLVDKGTPKFQEACMKGSHIKSAELHYCRAIAGKQEVLYKVKFEGIKIVKAEVEVEELPEGNFQLVETISFLANKQTWTETTVGLDNSIGGNTEACYDQSKKMTMLDDGATVTSVILGAVAFCLAVVLVVVLVKKKKNAAPAVADGAAPTTPPDNPDQN